VVQRASQFSVLNLAEGKHEQVPNMSCSLQ